MRKLLTALVIGTAAFIVSHIVGGAAVNLWGSQLQAEARKALLRLPHEPWGAWWHAATAWWVIAFVLAIWVVGGGMVFLRAWPEMYYTRRVPGHVVAAAAPGYILGSCVACSAVILMFVCTPFYIAGCVIARRIGSSWIAREIRFRLEGWSYRRKMRRWEKQQFRADPEAQT